MNARVIESFDEEQTVAEKPNLSFLGFKPGLLLIFLLVSLVIWVAITLMRPDILPIKSVRVEGEFRQLSPDRLEAIVIDTVRGGFFNVNVDVIQKVLLRDPWVYQVTVRRNWPDSLTVQVTEQVAVAQWGQQGLINSDGELFAPESYTYPKGLPILKGPENTYSRMLAQLILFQDVLKNTGYEISGINLNDRRSWKVRLTDGPLLIIGRKNVSTRMNRIAAYMQSGLNKNIQDMEIIDLRYTNGFAVRWKDNSKNSELGQDYHGQKS